MAYLQVCEQKFYNGALPKPIATKQKIMNKQKLNINNKPQTTEPSKQFGFEAIVMQIFCDTVRNLV